MESFNIVNKRFMIDDPTTIVLYLLVSVFLIWIISKLLDI
jgi:hypothetical protein|tara:strand:- start:137 stop:256 length:120 start_codon:yes stop_codon:yes gene_type:complete